MAAAMRRLRQAWRRGIDSDPRHYSPVTSQSRRDSFGYALAGCVHLLRHQKNTRIMLAGTVGALAAGLWLRIDARDGAILALATGLVWVAESVNAALEAAINLHAPQLHPLARMAKDVAAASALLAALTALVVGALILGPPLMAS